MKYFDNLEDAKTLLKSSLDEIFSDPDVNRVGIGKDRNGYFIEAVITPTRRIIFEGLKFKASVRDEFSFVSGPLEKNDFVDLSIDDMKDGMDTMRLETIQPGLSINNGGTIGAIVFHNKKPHLLSCDHVLRRNNGRTSLTNTMSKRLIASYIHNDQRPFLDCAIAEIPGDLIGSLKYEVYQIGAIPKYGIYPELHMPVMKYGSRTGFTRGYVRLIEVYKPDTREETYFEIQPYKTINKPTDSFSEAGDSGSIILSEINPEEVVGIHFQGAYFHDSQDDFQLGSLSLSVQDAIEKLKIEFTT